MKIKDLTTEQLKFLVQEAVEEKIEEMLGDPESGLKLREEVKEKLSASLAAMQSGERGTAIEQVASEAGLNW